MTIPTDREQPNILLIMSDEHDPMCSSTHGHPPEWELYDLEVDPGEFTNLAGQPTYGEVVDNLTEHILEKWEDPDRLTREIVASQERRYLMRKVSENGPLF